jgi:hypothetical protein
MQNPKFQQTGSKIDEIMGAVDRAPPRRHNKRLSAGQPLGTKRVPPPGAKVPVGHTKLQSGNRGTELASPAGPAGGAWDGGARDDALRTAPSGTPVLKKCRSSVHERLRAAIEHNSVHKLRATHGHLLDPDEGSHVGVIAQLCFADHHQAEATLRRIDSAQDADGFRAPARRPATAGSYRSGEGGVAASARGGGADQGRGGAGADGPRPRCAAGPTLLPAHAH